MQTPPHVYAQQIHTHLLFCLQSAFCHSFSTDCSINSWYVKAQSSICFISYLLYVRCYSDAVTQMHTYPNKCTHLKEQQTRTQCNIMLSSSREQLSRAPKASALCHYFRVIVLKVTSAACHSLTQGRTKKWRPQMICNLVVVSCNF